MSFYGDGQEAEDGGAECYKHAALSDEPDVGGELEGLLSGQEQVYHVGNSSQEVAQRQVSDEEVHAVVELVVPPYGHQDSEVL